MIRFLIFWALIFSNSIWALELLSDAEIYKQLASSLKPNEEGITRSVKRLGHNTIELESMIATDGDSRVADRVLGDFGHYSNWALENINRRAGGGEYYVRLDSLGLSPTDKSVLVAAVTINLPLFKRAEECAFRMAREQHGEVLTLTAVAIPDKKSVLTSMEAYMKVFPASPAHNWIWAYTRTRIVIKNWLLYEALPEKVLSRESNDRLETVLDNYHREEDKFRAPASIKSKKKRAKPGRNVQ